MSGGKGEVDGNDLWGEFNLEGTEFHIFVFFWWFENENLNNLL
jgi:hypothetical protein